MPKCRCGNPLKVGEPANQCWCCYREITDQADVPSDEKLELSLKERDSNSTYVK